MQVNLAPMRSVIHPISNELSIGISQTHAGDSCTHEICNQSHLQRVILHIIRCDGIDLCIIVQENHAALPIDLHFGHIFDHMPMLKGVWIQEGSLCGLCYALETSSWGFLGVVIFIWWVQVPFFNAVPSL